MSLSMRIVRVPFMCYSVTHNAGLLRGRRAVSPGMALRLARLFGNSAEFWLNAQRAVDLWDAAQAIGNDMLRIKPLRVA